VWPFSPGPHLALHGGEGGVDELGLGPEQVAQPRIAQAQALQVGELGGEVLPPAGRRAEREEGRQDKDGLRGPCKEERSTNRGRSRPSSWETWAAVLILRF
jgi:hypothetical protein